MLLCLSTTFFIFFNFFFAAVLEICFHLTAKLDYHIWQILSTSFSNFFTGFYKKIESLLYSAAPALYIDPINRDPSHILRSIALHARLSFLSILIWKIILRSIGNLLFGVLIHWYHLNIVASFITGLYSYNTLRKALSCIISKSSFPTAVVKNSVMIR